MEGASSRGRIGPSLSGALQVFPGGNGRLLLSGRSLRGAERPACKPRGTRGIVALVELAACGAGGPDVSDPLDVAFAPSCRLDAHRQPTGIGSRIRGVAPLRQPRSALRRSRVGGRHSQAIGTRMDPSATRKTKETRIATETSHPSWIWWLSPLIPPFNSSTASALEAPCGQTGRQTAHATEPPALLRRALRPLSSECPPDRCPQTRD